MNGIKEGSKSATKLTLFQIWFQTLVTKIQLIFIWLQTLVTKVQIIPTWLQINTSEKNGFTHVFHFEESSNLAIA